MTGGELIHSTLLKKDLLGFSLQFFRLGHNPTMRWGFWDLRPPWKYPGGSRHPTLKCPSSAQTSLRVQTSKEPTNNGLGIHEGMNEGIVSFLHNLGQGTESPFFRWGNWNLLSKQDTITGLLSPKTRFLELSGYLLITHHQGFLTLHKFHSVLFPHPLPQCLYLLPLSFPFSSIANI